MTVRVVTDSASDLPRGLAEELGVAIVPLTVSFGAEAFKDGVDITADDLYRRLGREKALPTTSQPSVGDFVAVYRRLAAQADGIVSVHISSKVSGTVNSARQAMEQAGVACHVEVVDTYQASMGVGLVAVAAARAAARGCGFEEVVATARSAVARCQCMAALGTLEYLYRGGRIGKAQALMGSLLKIRPLIILSDGEVHPLGRVRTRAKAVDRLREEARKYGPFESLAVIYSTTPDEAASLAEDLKDLLSKGMGEPIIGRFGSVLGTYVGPEALGVALLSAREGPAPGPQAG